jgi:hypothetical protein
MGSAHGSRTNRATEKPFNTNTASHGLAPHGIFMPWGMKMISNHFHEVFVLSPAIYRPNNLNGRG